MIARCRAQPRGFTLIEMLVVMTGVSAVLGLCVVTIQLLMRVSTDAQERRGAAAALGRLAEQFREDVNGCDDAQLGASGELRLGDGPRASVRYAARDGRMERVESTGGQATRHETYALGKGASATFERRDDGPRQFLVLVVSRKARAGHPDPPRPIEILALVGKDRPGPLHSKGGPAR
jgi:prepilin-type N-terminal cleavage/methylation domain-containing protein